MPALFDHPHVVTAEEIDPQRHANNVVFVQWLQDAAIAHSSAQGWPPSRYREAGTAWVARSHFVEYRRPAFEGDRIIVRTWVADMQRVSSLRRYQVLRAEGEVLLAIAETNWAFVSTAEERLIRIPDEVAGAFEILERRLK